MADTNPESNPDPNLLTYNAPQVAQYYAGLNYLTPCERLLFETSLQPGIAILDLGVGGGRTTSFLSAIASRYVGIDYAPEMIAACRKKFPELEFATANAADLSRFTSSSFEAAVMAFNGIDYVIPDEARFRALREIQRVLKPGGILIFSSHNPRSIWVRPSWNPQRVRDLAESAVASDSVLFGPLLRFLTMARVILAGLQAAVQSLAGVVRKIPTQVFWRGDGYWMDPAHGGLRTHVAVPKKVAQELQGFGFQLLRQLGDDYPQPSGLYVTQWYYYVFSKTQVSGEK
jgi:ubiquinone/menaquinone biosynthesis C-methylase UbiE